MLKKTFLLLLVVSWIPAVAVVKDEEGFTPIFDGKTLRGWDGDPRFWSVRDGSIVGKTTSDNPTEHNTFLVWRQGELDDFVLRFSYKIIGGNSGVQYRSREIDKWVIAGYQADFESGDKYSGISYEERGRGILAWQGQKVRIQPDGEIEVLEEFAKKEDLLGTIKKEDWNDYEVSARGNRLIHKINGKIFCEIIDDQAEKRAYTGLLAFQLHAGEPMEIQVRNVRLKRLSLEGRKKIVLVAGNASHGKGEHEFPAGVYLLRNCLDQRPEEVVAADYYGGWPEDPTAFDNADTIAFYLDGGVRHPAVIDGHLRILGKWMKKGVGLACIHYAVEVPKENGGPEFLKWIGGYYETGFSTNPHWRADLKVNAEHPIGRGVAPFPLNDEWYYNIRFRPGLQGVTRILSAVPPDDTRRTPAAREHPGREEILAWASESENGQRGFGFTGGHFHEAWLDSNFRKVVLNALYWTAHAEIPEGGVETTLTRDELDEALRVKP